MSTPDRNGTTDPTSPSMEGHTPKRVALSFGACTDSGRLRPANEDAMHAGPQICVVADGLGGHNAGDVASTLAVSTLIELALGGIATPEELGQAVQNANKAVFEASAADSTLRGMGTTLTALAVLPGSTPAVMVANVGDSRASVYRDGDFIRVSKDHSRVQEMVDAGEIDPDKAWGHPDSNVLTRALGLQSPVEIDVYVAGVRHGDRFILCTDGLIDEVREEDIAEALWRHRDPQVCAEKLVDMANANGGHDNITVIVADVVVSDS